MALPQKVVDRLAWEKPKTPGWSGHMLILTFTVFIFTLFAYFGLRFGLVAYLQNQVLGIDEEIASLQAHITGDDQKNLSSFYSQLVNVQTLLRGHVHVSPLFSWVEEHTARDVQITSFSVAPGTQTLSLGLVAKDFDTMIQQIARLQENEDLKEVSIGGIGREKDSNDLRGAATSTVPRAAGWTFTAALTFRDNFFRGEKQAAQ